VGRCAGAGRPERRHVGFSRVSSSFVTRGVTLMGRSARTAVDRRGSRSDMGRAGGAGSRLASRAGAGPIVGGTGGPSA
jgi:hypothetical protein